MKSEPETYEAMLNRAMWYLGRRDYGTQELRQKLLRPRPDKPRPDGDICGQVIARLGELGLLDDARMAQRLAESLSNKGYAARGIAYELRRRGLAEEPELPVEDIERLAELLEKKYAPRLRDERGRRGVYQALLRRGFSHTDLRRAMREYLEENRYGEEGFEDG